MPNHDMKQHESDQSDCEMEREFLVRHVPGFRTPSGTKLLENDRTLFLKKEFTKG